MWCCPSLSGHTTIKDVCPVLYSYCLHCGWAFHSASKGMGTVILLDLRIPPVKLKPWQLLPASFCEVLHKSHRTTSDKLRGDQKLFSSSEWDLNFSACTVDASRMSRLWPGREGQDAAWKPAAPSKYYNVIYSSLSDVNYTNTDWGTRRDKSLMVSLQLGALLK